jgi:ABC-type Fe3+-hydroxamate transport system substrate-binding protein
MLLSLLVFLAIASAAIGCGGPSVKTNQNTGTTAGSYTVSVTGASGSTKATTAVVVTVE